MFVRTLYVWVLLGLPFGFWLLRRREHRRDAAIRNLSIAIEQSHAAVRGGELALKVALERAESGDRAKDRFLATMSHEMRTPLNGISGFTSLLGETKLTPEQAEYVESIRRSSNALIQLT